MSPFSRWAAKLALPLSQQIQMRSVTRGKKGNKLATGEFGHGGIRKHDLLRHFQRPRNKLHQDAVKWQSESVSEKKEEDAREDVPSAVRFRIAYSLLKKNPLAATDKMYEKACLEARTSGDENVLPFRCLNQILGRISRATGQAVVHDLHRRLAKRNNKNPPRWACLAEDNGERFLSCGCLLGLESPWRQEEGSVINDGRNLNQGVGKIHDVCPRGVWMTGRWNISLYSI